MWPTLSHYADRRRLAPPSRSCIGEVARPGKLSPLAYASFLAQRASERRNCAMRQSQLTGPQGLLSNVATFDDGALCVAPTHKRLALA